MKDEITERSEYGQKGEGSPEVSPFVMERLGRLEDLDRSFDLEFWQRQDSNARFSAAWELVVFAHEHKGRDAAELRLQRSIESLERRES